MPMEDTRAEILGFVGQLHMPINLKSVGHTHTQKSAVAIKDTQPGELRICLDQT